MDTSIVVRTRFVNGHHVVDVVIDGIIFSTSAPDANTAIAIAERISRKLGFDV